MLAGAPMEPVESGDLSALLGANDHTLVVRRCSLRRKRLYPDGEFMSLGINEALAMLAPSGAKQARLNVLRLRAGHFVGVRSDTDANFVIVNPTADGDIRWLLKKHPNLPDRVRDIYLVESVAIPRNAIDLPMEDDNGD